MMDAESVNTLTQHRLQEAMVYYRWISREISPHLGREILEVGCGIGHLTGWLLSQGRVTATDVNPTYLQTVEEKYRDHLQLKEILIWDIGQNGPPNFEGSFDTIVCSNVLEHVENDEAVLRNFHPLLSPGGRLIIFVPALRILYNGLDRELGHFRRYQREDLSRKMEGNGFRIRHLNYFNLFGILGWFVNGTLLRKRLLSASQIRIFDKMVPLFVGVERIIPARVGLSLIAVGEKS